MRAKLPHTEGTIDNNGIKSHYEVYGHGEHTILFAPTWSIVNGGAKRDHFGGVRRDRLAAAGLSP